MRSLIIQGAIWTLLASILLAMLIVIGICQSAASIADPPRNFSYWANGCKWSNRGGAIWNCVFITYDQLSGEGAIRGNSGGILVGERERIIDLGGDFQSRWSSGYAPTPQPAAKTIRYEYNPLPHWTSEYRHSIYPESFDATYVIVGYGFPLRCATLTVIRSRGQPMISPDGWLLKGSSVVFPLPGSVIGWSLLTDIAVCFGLVMVPYYSCAYIRRSRRRRRELCIRCGYPLLKNRTCSECGNSNDEYEDISGFA